MAKVMISLPDELLAALDEAAQRADTTRSAFIRQAVRERLARGPVDRARRDAAVEHLRRAFSDATFNPEDFIRADRER
jgi:metal-responsive CopG/Arc/MetJ family transcriptional regulator